MSADKIDVLAILTPAPGQIVRGWTYVDSRRVPEKQPAQDFDPDNVPEKVTIVTFHRYEAKIGFSCKADDEPRPVALLDVEKLEDARAAVEKLLAAAQFALDFGDEPALASERNRLLREAIAGMGETL